MTSGTPVWLVTGTSSGLGKSLVHAILSSGQRVIATLRNPVHLSPLQDQYPSTQLVVTRLDVTVDDEIAAVFDLAKKHFNRLDFVVNNAGYGVLGEIEAVPEDVARAVFEVQFWGPVKITKKAIKFFHEVNPEGHGGRIFNVSTIGGYTGVPGLAFYNASKFALEGFTEAFTNEMPSSWNIKGIILEPGGFASEWAKNSMVTISQPAIYADPSNPSTQMRQQLNPANADPIGDSDKIAQAILRIAVEPNPPLRLQLGSESWAIIKDKALNTIADMDKWANISQSTNRDGIDGAEYAQKIMDIIRRP